MAAPPPMAGYVTPMPPMGAPMGIGMKHPNEGASEEEPSNKKLRNEDSLIPEEVFLARNAVCGFFFLYYRLLHRLLHYLILHFKQCCFRIL